VCSSKNFSQGFLPSRVADQGRCAELTCFVGDLHVTDLRSVRERSGLASSISCLRRLLRISVLTLSLLEIRYSFFINRNIQPVNFIDIFSKKYSDGMFMSSYLRNISWFAFTVADTIVAYAAAYDSSIFTHPDSRYIRMSVSECIASEAHLPGEEEKYMFGCKPSERVCVYMCMCVCF